MRDYYEVLGVSRDASADEIRAAYKRLRGPLHPDNKVTGDEARFREVVEAYRVLGDPTERARYDAPGSSSSTDRAAFIESFEREWERATGRRLEDVAAELARGLVRALLRPRDRVR